jgi:hypothetical protein
MNGDSIASFRLDDILLRVDSGVGINKINENDFSAFPNPSTGKLFLSGLSGTGNLTVEVVNSTGQSIYMKKTSSLDNYEIDLAGQPSGIYMVRIISDKGITVKKISINR